MGIFSPLRRCGNTWKRNTSQWRVCRRHPSQMVPLAKHFPRTKCCRSSKAVLSKSAMWHAICVGPFLSTNLSLGTTWAWSLFANMLRTSSMNMASRVRQHCGQPCLSPSLVCNEMNCLQRDPGSGMAETLLWLHFGSLLLLQSKLAPMARSWSASVLLQGQLAETKIPFLEEIG